MNKLRQDVNVGANFRNLRKSKGLTQEAVVAKLQVLGFDDISRSSYSRYETGELNIKISHLRALKQIFKCTYEELLEGNIHGNN